MLVFLPTTSSERIPPVTPNCPDSSPPASCLPIGQRLSLALERSARSRHPVLSDMCTSRFFHRGQ
jgi:hypothetical protein